MASAPSTQPMAGASRILYHQPSGNTTLPGKGGSRVRQQRAGERQAAPAFQRAGKDQAPCSTHGSRQSAG